MLDIKKICWERDENGKIIPLTVETADKINGQIEKIKVIPLTRGERKRIMSSVNDDGNTDTDTDKELILNHIVEPKFTEEDIDATPFGVIEVLAITVLQASGLPVGKNVTAGEANKKKEKDFRNASDKSGGTEKNQT